MPLLLAQRPLRSTRLSFVRSAPRWRFRWPPPTASCDCSSLRRAPAPVPAAHGDGRRPRRRRGACGRSCCSPTSSTDYARRRAAPRRFAPAPRSVPTGASRLLRTTARRATGRTTPLLHQAQLPASSSAARNRRRRSAQQAHEPSGASPRTRPAGLLLHAGGRAGRRRAARREGPAPGRPAGRASVGAGGSRRAAPGTAPAAAPARRPPAAPAARAASDSPQSRLHAARAAARRRRSPRSRERRPRRTSTAALRGSGSVGAGQRHIGAVFRARWSVDGVYRRQRDMAVEIRWSCDVDRRPAPSVGFFRLRLNNPTLDPMEPVPRPRGSATPTEPASSMPPLTFAGAAARAPRRDPPTAGAAARAPRQSTDDTPRSRGRRSRPTEAPLPS